MAGATATVIAAMINAAVSNKIMRFMRITSFLSRSPAFACVYATIPENPKHLNTF